MTTGGVVDTGGGAGGAGGVSLERALHYEGSWYEAIKSKDATLINALIHIRGALALRKGSVVAALHHAVFDGTRQIVELFLQHGCDVNGRDTAYSGVTPLMEAVRKEDLGVVVVLLEHGARLDLLDSCHDNVIHWACRYTSGTFLRRFLALAESRGGGLPRSALLSLATSPNGKGHTPSQVAKSAMVRAYLQKYIDNTTTSSGHSHQRIGGGLGGGHHGNNNNNASSNNNHHHGGGSNYYNSSSSSTGALLSSTTLVGGLNSSSNHHHLHRISITTANTPPR